MQKAKINLSVTRGANFLKQSIQEKGLTVFCDIDHQANAKKHGLDMPLSRVLIFGNPQLGTHLMQKDMKISIELPLRLAVIDNNGETLVLYPNVKDFGRDYPLVDHAVLGAMQTLFNTLLAEVTSYA